MYKWGAQALYAVHRVVLDLKPVTLVVLWERAAWRCWVWGYVLAPTCVAKLRDSGRSLYSQDVGPLLAVGV